MARKLYRFPVFKKPFRKKKQSKKTSEYEVELEITVPQYPPTYNSGSIDQQEKEGDRGVEIIDLNDDMSSKFIL